MAVEHAVIIRNGTIYDGSGGDPVAGDVIVDGDTITTVGGTADGRGRTEIDATGLAVAPGFINMLSWADVALLADGRSQSDIRQGVTLEVMGEGWSPGPLNAAMKQDRLARQSDFQYDIPWTTLGEYLEHLVARGVSTNVASFVGAATVRIHELDHADVAPTPAQLARMCDLVRQAMAEGALGVASALIYVPACFATTDELIALARAAAEYDGLYISHIRSEGPRFEEAVDEHLAITRAAGVRSEIYHLKAAGRENWGKLDAVIAKIEAARASGLPVTADMYTYTVGATGLDASLPPWVQEGGLAAMVARLRDPAIRARVIAEVGTPTDAWENNDLLAGSADRLLLAAFKSEALKPFTGKTLAEVAALRGQSPEATLVDLVAEDESRVGTLYFTIDEANVRRELALPWVSFGSDAASLAPEGLFLRSNPHPRAYGTFARLLGYYVRDEGIIPLADAIRRLTALPAANLRLTRRGRMAPGYYADVAVFDPATIADHATYADPHQYATGMVHVLVNGVPVLRDGDHTDARPGRVVRGPGWRGAV